MALRWIYSLTLAAVAWLAVASIDPAQTAHGQRDATPGSKAADRSSNARPSAGGNQSDADRLRTYARSLIERSDKNGDKMLQASERTELRGKPAEADLNHDDVITLDELVIHLSPKPAGATAAPSSPAAGSATPSVATATGQNGAGGREREAKPAQRVYSASSAAAGKSDAKRKSYRFTPPAERLPSSGLPSWFKSRDANGDGQVAMHEYSRSWNDRTAAEFTRYDKDNNGVITAKEAKR